MQYRYARVNIALMDHFHMSNSIFVKLLYCESILTDKSLTVKTFIVKVFTDHQRIAYVCGTKTAPNYFSKNFGKA